MGIDTKDIFSYPWWVHFPMEGVLMTRPRTLVSPGDRYGRLVIAREVESRLLPSGKFHRRVECECDCGAAGEYALYRVRSGSTKSCGCLAREMAAERFGGRVTHGFTGTARYAVWMGMKARCYNPKSSAYENYGGRGIGICDRWLKSFPAFLEDMGERPSSDHSIDRIDNDGDYEPGNCRWATRTEQSRNMRSNVMVEHDGETLCLAEWAERYGVGPEQLNYRLKTGWSFEEAVSCSIRTNPDFNPTMPISQRTPEWYREFARRESPSSSQ